MKYAKWKAVEIDRCLKNGITPTPGPPGGEDEEEEKEEAQVPQYGFSVAPGPSEAIHPSVYPLSEPHPEPARPVPRPRQNPPPPEEPAAPPPHTVTPAPVPAPILAPVTLPTYQVAAGVQLSTSQIATAQKYCKYASSSLDYDDTVGAIEFLNKALRLLTTGKED